MVTHAKVSAKSDGGDASLVLPSDWNAEHVGSVPVLLAYCYDTASGSVGITSSTLVDVDATNAITGSFTAPASGHVIVRITGAATNSGDINCYVGVREGTTILGSKVFAVNTQALKDEEFSCVVDITGLSAGSHTFKLAAATNSGTFTLRSFTTSPLVMEVYSGDVVLLNGSGASLLLDYTYAGSDLSGSSMTGGSDFDITGNQTFTVVSPSSLIEVVVKAVAQSKKSSGGDTIVDAKIIVDSAGTPITKYIGGQVLNSSNYMSPFSGTGSMFLSGLAAGSHTIKVVLNPISTSDLYLRPSAMSGAEFLTVQVVEHSIGLSGGPTIIRGRVNSDGTVAAGTGFSSVKTATGIYTVTFDTAFLTAPAVVVGHYAAGASGFAFVFSVPTTTAFDVLTTVFGGSNTDRAFSFIATAI